MLNSDHSARRQFAVANRKQNVRWAEQAPGHTHKKRKKMSPMLYYWNLAGILIALPERVVPGSGGSVPPSACAGVSTLVGEFVLGAVTLVWEFVLGVTCVSDRESS